MFLDGKVNGESVNYSADMHRNAYGWIALHIHFQVDKDLPLPRGNGFIRMPGLYGRDSCAAGKDV